MFPLVTVDSVLWPADSTATMIPATDIPDPYRELLAHSLHMTVVVEEFYKSPVDVRVLESGRDAGGDSYYRRIVLTLRGTDRIVQYGLVRIDLGCLPEPVRDAIVAEKTPLGRVLIDHNVLRRIEPTAFLKVQPGPTLMQQLGLADSSTLYGRTGVIFCDDRPAIAVLELLCPA
ncbi:MAG: hypothetical protein EXS09_10930 [Gemmataceae bacterium]|nr:hypothetical protein [Gemmataceae bacterium]